MFREILLIIWMLACLGFASWCAMAVWFSLPVRRSGKYLTIAIIAAVTIAYFSVLLFYLPSEASLWPAHVVFIGMIAFIMAWWLFMKPSLDHDWAADVQHTVTAEYDHREITFHNIRDFTWKSESEVIANWKSETYRLDSIRSVDVLMSYWTHPAIAHTLVSFGFKDGRRLVFSAEIRKKKGQVYSPIGGFFRSYELALIAAEERDIVFVRTNIRNERVYRYPIKASPRLLRAMLLRYADAANALAGKPAFYNTMTANCTTVVFNLVRTLVPDFPFDYRIVLSGYLPEFLYDHGLIIGSDRPFEEIRKAALIVPDPQPREKNLAPATP
ncbi:DUF4105 domain-containing protein [Daeguia caeni]|uniref:DUF4105 domain-containing protein n=1 Tax=Daeguia caeni TaxID=439612 RepID=A0ABV9H9Y8_9HYPH